MRTAPAHTDGLLASASARFFRVLGDPTRLQILELLSQGPHTVSELMAETGLQQSKLSNHLACLRWCEFVDTERHGRHITYRLRDPRLDALLDSVREVIAGRAEHLASCRRIGPDWI